MSTLESYVLPVGNMTRISSVDKQPSYPQDTKMKATEYREALDNYMHTINPL